MLVVVFTESAIEDRADFQKADRALIIDTAMAQLAYEPTIRTRNRKPLRSNDLSR